MTTKPNKDRIITLDDAYYSCNDNIINLDPPIPTCNHCGKEIKCHCNENKEKQTMKYNCIIQCDSDHCKRKGRDTTSIIRTIKGNKHVEIEFWEDGSIVVLMEDLRDREETIFEVKPDFKEIKKAFNTMNAYLDKEDK